jgi:hemoglobin
MRRSVFEAAGGDSAFLALAAAHHQRCLDDPVLNHPFSHPGHPEHVERLAHYWAEVFGGPARFSQSYGGQSAMLRLHAGQGMDSDLGERFVACFRLAQDDAQLPEDKELRAVLTGYMEWATAEVDSYSEPGSQVPDGLSVPHWDWNGLVEGD